MNKQVCKVCDKEKPLPEFHRHKEMASGYDRRCKECEKARHRKAYQANIIVERRKSREHARKQYYKNVEHTRERIKKNNKTWRKKYPEKKAQETVEYRIKYPERWAAQQAIKNLVRRKGFQKPKYCEKCNKSCTTQAHHHSYEPEFWLDVKWLCGVCHSMEGD